MLLKLSRLIQQEMCSMFQLDCRSLAVFRMGLGVLILVDLCERGPDLVSFLSDDGAFPRSIASYASHDWRISIHMANGEPVFQWILFVVAGLSAVALACGYQTRVAIILSWAMLVSLQNRNPYVLYGADTLLRMMLFWGMFLPLNREWSVDRILSGYAESGIPRQASVFSAGSVCLILQILLMYVFSALLKTDPMWRKDGSAVSIVLKLRQMATPLGLELSENETFTELATFGTMILEGLVPLVLLVPIVSRRLRLLVVVSFIIFHLSHAVLMRIGLFPYVSICAWLVFLPGWVWGYTIADGSEKLSVAGSCLDQNGHAVTIRVGIANGVAIAAMTLVLWVNITAIWHRPDLCKPLDPILYATQVRQQWDMFAPRPLLRTQWYIVEAELIDGRVYDALRGFGSVDDSMPECAKEAMPSVRWRKFLNAMRERDSPREWRSVCEDFARISEDKFGRDSVRQIRVRFLQVHHNTDGTQQEMMQETLFVHTRE